MRALILLILLTPFVGCDAARECKQGTVFVVATYPAGVEQLTVTISLDTGGEAAGILPNPASATKGSAQIDFDNYPVGSVATISVRAFIGEVAVAGKTTTVTIGPTCTRVALALDDAEVDGGLDLGIDDLSSADLTNPCPMNQHYCEGSGCVDDTSVNTCGTSCTPCQSPTNGSVACVQSMCAVSCNAGFVPVGMTCDVAAPRLIYPGSNTYTSDRRPIFEWKLATGTDGAHIEVCTDRACTNIIHSADVTGTTYDTPTELIAPGTLFWRVFGRIGTTTGTTSSAVWESQPMKHDRPAGVDPPQSCFGRLSDINNDGYADVVVGDDEAPATLGIGKIYVHPGSSSGPTTEATTVYAGGVGDEQFSLSMSYLGDVDGDGYSDLIVGGGNIGIGKAYFFRGSAAGLITSSVTVLQSSATDPNGDFGYHVRGAGDVNGDGYADAIVGGYQIGSANGGQGAWIFHGGPAGLPTTPSTTLDIPVGSTWFGYVNGAGDVNRDGYADVLVADPGINKAYLYLGGPSGIPTAPSQTLVTPGTISGRYGEGLASAGDVDADGYADIVIAARSDRQAWVYLGIATGINSIPDEMLPSGMMGPSSYGQSADGIGDVNGDGYSDVGVAALNNTMQFVYVGYAGGINQNGITITAPANSGFQIAGAGDTNGDGIADFILTSQAAASLYYGNGAAVPTTVSRTVTETAVTITGRYGISVQ